MSTRRTRTSRECSSTGFSRTRRSSGRRSNPRQIDHEIILLHRHCEGLGNIGAFDEARPRLDRDAELAGAGGVGIAPGLAGADIELPAVPGAAQKFVVA